jgi:peptidoglycan/LPS O-acetylase OafA/YrhL
VVSRLLAAAGEVSIHDPSYEGNIGSYASEARKLSTRSRASNEREGLQAPSADGKHSLRRVLDATIAPWCCERFELPSRGGRIVPMEGLRGLSVLLVFLVHFHALFSTLAPRESLSFLLSEFGGAIGNAGVDLFFVISGYLIYRAVFNKRVRLLRFLSRRVRRIYPTFLCVFTIYLIGAAVMPTEARVPWSSIGLIPYLAENLLLLPGLLPIVPLITVAWSLSYEFFYYITMPILVTLLEVREWPRSRRVAAFLLLASSHAVLAGLGVIGHLRLSMFVVGMLLYEAIESGAFDRWLGTVGERLSLVGFSLGLLAIGWLTMDRPEHRVLPSRASVLDVYRFVILSGTTFALLLYSFRFDGLVRNFFSFAPMRWLGNMSYSYYLIHGLTLRVLCTVLQQAGWLSGKSLIMFWSLLFAGVITTCAVSALLFLLVERPFSLVIAAPAGEQIMSPGTGLVERRNSDKNATTRLHRGATI